MVMVWSWSLPCHCCVMSWSSHVMLVWFSYMLTLTSCHTIKTFPFVKYVSTWLSTCMGPGNTSQVVPVLHPLFPSFFSLDAICIFLSQPLELNHVYYTLMLYMLLARLMSLQWQHDMRIQSCHESHDSPWSWWLMTAHDCSCMHARMRMWKKQAWAKGGRHLEGQW